MAIATDQHILRLEISMDDAVRVQVLESCHKVCEIELRSLEVKLANTFDKCTKVATLHVLHHHVEVLTALESVNASHNEVIVD